MGRNKRLNYELVAGLYESNYGQALIGRILETPHGHISKVLRGMDVKTRKRGEKVSPVHFKDLDKRIKDMLKMDVEVMDKYQEYTGFDTEEVESVKKEWKDMNKEEKVEVIMDKLNGGMTTREAAKELGIAQSTLVKTKNS